jgi:hypothetical protein
MQVAFGVKAGFDLGGSDRERGHLRVKLFNNADQPLPDAYDGIVAENGFPTSESLVEQIAQKIAQTWQKAKSLGHVPQDEPLTHVVGTVPGPAKQGKVSLLTNVLDKLGKPLSDIDFNALTHNLPEAKVLLLNDMAGGTAKALELMLADKQNPLKPGQRATYMAVGGGFGVADFAHSGHSADLYLGEGGHQNAVGGQGKNLEMSGASVGSLLSSFASGLNVSPVVAKALQATGDARLVFNKEAFVKRFPNVSTANFQSSSIAAQRQLIDAVMQGVAVKLLAGYNAAVLTGPLLSGLMRSIDSHPQAFAADSQVALQALGDNAASLPFHQQVLMGRLWQQLDGAGQGLVKQNGFHFKTDMMVPDNLEGVPMLLHAKPVGERSDWLRFPLVAKS